jgi:UDP-N-acetylglucosamine--dolichyl-phosphate N-acetylglucosaminephosphotransferase
MAVNIELIAAILLSSAAIAFVSLPFLIKKFMAAKMTGKDVNKAGCPEVAEMGGLGIVMGAIGSLLVAIAFQTFLGFQFRLIEILAAMLTILIISLIGTFDDLFSMRQYVKAVLPMAAAVPLVAVSAAGSTAISIPFLGSVDFGFLYIFLLIPLGVTVASNLTNMLAGFNGMESGMGVVIFAATLLLSLATGSMEMAMISAAMLGALLAFTRFNWYPAKVFTGDIGNLTIGAALASAVIIGNLEAAGAILVIPYVIDFFIKAANRFPSTNWWGELRGGKLYPLGGKARGLAQFVMKLAGGISEQRLVLSFIAAESLCALLAILLYGKVL